MNCLPEEETKSTVNNVRDCEQQWNIFFVACQYGHHSFFRTRHKFWLLSERALDLGLFLLELRCSGDTQISRWKGCKDWIKLVWLSTPSPGSLLALPHLTRICS
jgi:hypothetical protein